MRRILCFGLPLLAVLVIFGGSWVQNSLSEDAPSLSAQPPVQLLRGQEAVEDIEAVRREYALEVLGLGVTYEKYRQGKLWNALHQGGSGRSIREHDPKKYEWDKYDKIGDSGSRALDALENGVARSPMFWGVPTLYAGGPIENPAFQPSPIQPIAGLAGSSENTGLYWHLFVTGPWQLSERPDQLLEKVFALFDTYPDLPYVVLLASDDMDWRNSTRLPGTPELVKDGHYIPERPDATAVFVLARRERVEVLRPYVWEDPENDYLQENLRRMYYELKDAVPNPEELAHPDKRNYGRQPSIGEWLPTASAFAKNPVFVRTKKDALVEEPKRKMKGPPKNWKPTPWFPLPWNRDQMDAFEDLPSLGFIHRPVFVRFEDKQGRPVTRRDQRQKILEAGWKQALQTLPEAERAKGPARIVAAFNKNVDQMAALRGLLQQYAEDGGPKISTSKTAQFINSDYRLGDTGAATFFVQMAIGVMGSYIEGGPSAAINMRDPAGASIVFVRPPLAERRHDQRNWDVFKHQVEPAIDPNNYQPPSMDSALARPK
jgi:hypothetical protein